MPGPQMRLAQKGSTMSYPMIGKSYEVRFPTMAFVLTFLSDKRLRFTVQSSPDLPAGSSHEVDIVMQPLRDGLYLVSWQEASGNTVVHVEDFNEHRVHAFLTMKDGMFIRQDAPLVEVGST
jgi:hypothetical protein